MSQLLLESYLKYLKQNANFMIGLTESKLKTKIYPLKNFLNPQSVLKLLVQSERRRLKLPNGIVYLRLLGSAQP
jgi:hypothetical protein